MAKMGEPQFPSILEKKSFLRALFDFDFKEWVTLRIAGLLYGILIAIASVAVIIVLIGIAVSGAEGAVIFGALLGGLLAWFVLVIFFRLVIEASIATIAVAQNTANLRK